MQHLSIAKSRAARAEACAAQVLAAVPLLMRFIREQMRRHPMRRLSVPQFRTLAVLSHSAEISLSALAEQVGLSLSAASRMVETLVKRRLVERRARTSDRRCVSLSLTPGGHRALRTALRATQLALGRRFAQLSAAELLLISRSMRVLSGVFAAELPRASEVE
jgi:DNA-binding MarR family transcriptional regulator